MGAVADVLGNGVGEGEEGSPHPVGELVHQDPVQEDLSFADQHYKLRISSILRISSSLRICLSRMI